MDPWPAGMHELHCREDRCVYGCDCPCHRGEPVPRLHYRWFMWRRYRIPWVSAAWSFMWTHGTFARRFWTVVITGLAVYVIADVVVAWLA